MRKVLFRRAFQNTQKGCCIIYNNPLIKTGNAHRILSYYKSYCKYLVRSSGRKAFFIFLICCFAPFAVPFWTCRYHGTKKAERFHALLFTKTGNVLFSRAASRQVSSALGSLTSVFEMGTGGSSPPLSPDHCSSFSPIAALLSVGPMLTYSGMLRFGLRRAPCAERKILRNLFNLPFETKNRDQIFYLHSLSDYLPLIKLSID